MANEDTTKFATANRCCDLSLKLYETAITSKIKLNGEDHEFFVVECPKCKKRYVRAFDILDTINNSANVTNVKNIHSKIFDPQ